MFGISYSYLAALLLFAFFIFGCQMENGKNTNKEDLSKYIVVPSGTQSVAFELVTLPENNQEGVPGPTDYVSLVAVIDFDEPSRSGGLNEIGPGYFFGFPEVFIREWMSNSIKENFRSMSNKSDRFKYFDVKKIVRGNVKKAVGVYPNDKTLLLYVEYVFP